MNMFNFIKSDRVAIHYESTKNLMQTIKMYKDRVDEVFVAINPATPISLLEEVVDVIDGVLVMCVNPGFAGQDMITTIPDKLSKIRKAYPLLKIEVDGHITQDYYKQFKQLGVEDFVVGTSFMFKNGLDETEQIIKNLINQN